MHIWGDKTVDWDGLEKVQDILADTCRRYGRIGGSIKEKWGMIRFDSRWGSLSLEHLCYPGHYYSRLPPWLGKIDNAVIAPVLNFCLGKLFFWWQKQVYNYAYQKAMRAYPHLRAEILHDADHLELIKGASRKEGNKTHVLGWQGEILATWETYSG